jgi:nicotinate phosphoribosyltransferase
VVTLAPHLKEKGISIKGVRLDSGDLADHARQVRRILDEGGLTEVQITASGNLDEYAIQSMVATNAPIDSFAVGTKMTASADAPYLDCAYKLQEYAGRARRKRSEGKATWPGRKQVYRYYDEDGRIAYDLLTVANDPQEGDALIQPVIRSGKRVSPPSSLAQLRDRAAAQLAKLPKPLQALQEGQSIPVKNSQALKDLAQFVDEGTHT